MDSTDRAFLLVIHFFLAGYVVSDIFEGLEHRDRLNELESFVEAYNTGQLTPGKFAIPESPFEPRFDTPEEVR